jgi:hypothetical protein
MKIQPDLAALTAEVQKLIDDAFQRGLQEGAERARKSILAAADVAFQSGGPTILGDPHGFAAVRWTAPGLPHKPCAPDLFTPPRSRAPKGLIDEILERVLGLCPGMTIAEVEKAVVNEDARIAAKSVFNRLRHLEKHTGEFKRVEKRWYRREDVPPSNPSVNGSQIAIPSRGFPGYVDPLSEGDPLMSP